MSFSTINEKNIKKVIVSEGPFSEMFTQVLEHKAPELYDKEPILRPSGFPICSILMLSRIAEHEKFGNTVQEGGLHSDFFTGIGTLVHEIIQNWSGKVSKLLADWQCVNPDCERSKCGNRDCKDSNCTDHTHCHTLQVGNICKKCGNPMVYHELEVEYSIITGHVDAILKTGKNKFWAGDYKTSSIKKLEEITVPSVGYLYQISTYAWILKNVYNINIVGFSIFYVARDNPGIFKEFKYDFDEDAEAKAKKLIDREIRKYKAAKAAHKTGDVYHAIDVKPCKSKDHYEKIYGKYAGCPFADVCFGPQKKLATAIETKLKEVLKR